VAVQEIGSSVTRIQGDISTLGDLARLFAQIERERASSVSSSPTLE
jgi:hypothetical protein